MKVCYAPLALIVASCAGLTLALSQTQPAGVNNRIFIASVTGEWVHMSIPNPEVRPVKFGQVVSETDCLYGKTGAVVVQRGEQLTPYSCDVSQQDKTCPAIRDDKTIVCSVRVGTNPKKATQGASSRWVASIGSLLQTNPDKYLIAASRGLEADLDEAVIPLTGSQLDLSTAFKDMSDGDYWIVLAPVNAGGKSSRPPLHLRYKRGAPAFVPAAGISPMLYNVILVDQGGATLGNEAWVLVRSPETYAAAASDFGQLVTASEKWPDEMDASAVRAILRAYLDRLADQK
jgi:hypothetical protein